LAAQYASGDYFLFLNDDVEVFEPDWLRALLEHGARPEVGAVGGLLLYPDGTIQHAGMFLDGAVGRHAYRGAPAEEPGTFGLALTQRNVIAVTGACMLMRRAVFTQMGGFDEAHSVVNNDLDFCLRLHRAGLRVIYTPYARLIHHELSSRADMPDVFDATRFGDDWRALFLRGDPYFHPALSTRDDGYNEETEPFEALMGVKPVLAHEHVRDIWLLGPDAAEDAALMFPALRRLRQYFPAARIHLLADAATLGLMAAEPVVDTFDVLAPPAEPDTDVGAASLAPYPADIALDLRLKPEGRAILKQTGAKLLAGFDSNGLFPWLQVPVAWEGRTRGRAPRQTLTDLALHLVEAVAAACPKPATLPARVPDASALAQWIEPSTARTFLERSIICIDPSPRAGLWQWPSERFAALIEMLCTSEDMNAVIIGAVEDTPLIDAIMAKLATPARVISLAGRVAPLELPAVLGACTLYVGNDSGRQHLAAAQPIPTVCISASHVDAVERAASGAHVVIVRRHVVCGPCYLAHPDHCDRDVYCLRSISPGDVFRACHRLLRLVYAEPEHEQERL
jgi:ADP-heptose:LPS heptosyltransferase